MRNLLMLLVAVLGTTVMVNAFPAKEAKVGPTKEVKATKHPKKKADKKVKAEAAKSETAKMK